PNAEPPERAPIGARFFWQSRSSAPRSLAARPDGCAFGPDIAEAVAFTGNDRQPLKPSRLCRLRAPRKTHMRSQAHLAETYGGIQSNSAPPTNAAHVAILRECYELFHFLATGIARLSIETSNDLFEMDKRVTVEEVYAFRSK